MTQLTEKQTNYILKTFFKHESYSGWEHIGSRLLDDGKCIVAGGNCIWRGGIGNFINTEPSTIAVNCLEYSFDLDEFLKSKWFKEVHNKHMFVLGKNRLDLDTEYEANKNNMLKHYNEIGQLGEIKPKPLWNYSVSSNSIWSNFDSGEVEADTYEEALRLAKLKLKYDFEKINHVLYSADITKGFNIEYSESSIELEKQK